MAPVKVMLANEVSEVQVSMTLFLTRQGGRPVLKATDNTLRTWLIATFDDNGNMFIEPGIPASTGWPLDQGGRLSTMMATSMGQVRQTPT